MNLDKTLQVSICLKLPLTMVQEFSMKQTQALSTLIETPISAFVKLTNQGLGSIRERFRREDYSGGLGKEIPFYQFESVLRQYGIIWDQFHPLEKLVILNGLCRYPETKIVNAQLFLHLLSYYAKKLNNTSNSNSYSNSNNNNNQSQSELFGNVILHAKTFYPEIVYVFDILHTRLPSSITDSMVYSRMISREDFIRLLIKIDVRLSMSDEQKLIDIMKRAQVYDSNSDTINMKDFLEFISQFCSNTSSLITIPSDRRSSTMASLASASATSASTSAAFSSSFGKSRVYAHLLHRLQSNAMLIKDRIRYHTRANSNRIDKKTLKASLHDSGITLTDGDFTGLWYYLFESEKGYGVDSVLVDEVDAKLLPSKMIEERTTLHSMPEEIPYQKMKKRIPQPLSQAPYAIDTLSSTQPQSVLKTEHKQSSVPSSLSIPKDTMGIESNVAIKMNEMSNNVNFNHNVNDSTNMISVPWKLHDDKTSKSNLCLRISSRVQNLSSDMMIKFIKSVVAIDSKVFARTNISKILSDFNIKVFHSDCDEIWSEISKSINSSKSMAFLEWLGISQDQIRNSISPKSYDKLVNVNDQYTENGNPDSLFQFIPRFSEGNRIKPNIINESQSNPWHFDSSLSGINLSQNDNNNDNNDNNNNSNSQNNDNRNDLLSQTSTTFESPSPKVDVSIDQISQQQKHKLLEAIVTLQRNRANLAFVFRKLLGKEGRLDDNSLPCQRLSEALLQPPISLQLTSKEVYRLICDMTNAAYDYDTAFSSTPRIFFRDIINYLDKQPTVNYTNNDNNDISSHSQSPYRNSKDTKTYRNHFLRFSVKSKLYDSLEVQGDKLKLLSLVPRLKSRHRSLLSRGKNVTSWEAHSPDLCSSLNLKELFHSIDVKLDTEEIRYIQEEVRLKQGDTYNNAGIGDYGVKLGDAILVLSEILE